MVSVGKIVSPSMVVDQPQGKVHVSCQDVEFLKNRDMKNISQVFINIREFTSIGDILIFLQQISHRTLKTERCPDICDIRLRAWSLTAGGWRTAQQASLKVGGKDISINFSPQTSNLKPPTACHCPVP
jgi:hypothetical protein